MDAHGDRVPIDAQSIGAPLSRAAIFLVLTIGEQDAQLDQVRDVIGGIDDLVKTVGFRDLNGDLSCVVGIGSDAWDRLSPGRRPAQLRPLPVIAGDPHTAVSTPGDLLLHIRAERADLCFELARLTLDALGDAVTLQDETQGFRYFDSRDLLGFVDGTANPRGGDVPEATLVDADDDPDFAGGSYVVVQRYVHDLDRWNGLSTTEQELIIGRTKADNVELDDDAAPRKSHKTLATIDDEGTERDILRDNMPFGRPGHGEFGTYFIGYTARLWVIERMLERMFLGDPPGDYDQILDVSTATTGTTFFAPSAAVLAALGDPPDAAAASAPTPAATEPQDAPAAAPSLGIGSLRPQP